MSNSTRNQSTFFKGIYEFEDPSGALVAATVPAAGSVDLYAGTAVIVRPNQCALFVYKGQIADVFLAGTNTVKTENLPVLTKLANWKFGFESPLRCELIFIAGQAFTARRWGTPQPVLTNFSEFGSVPIRSFGNFNVIVSDPKRFYMRLMGTRSSFSISEIDEYGLSVQKIQMLSVLPSKEVLEAMEAKTAIKIIGSQKEYLIYKAATSLGQKNDGQSNDPLQMMMGMMLGKGLLGADYHEKEKVTAIESKSFCNGCGKSMQSDSRFCPSCGKRV